VAFAENCREKYITGCKLFIKTTDKYNRNGEHGRSLYYNFIVTIVEKYMEVISNDN